jgi:hypothetical protein
MWTGFSKQLLRWVNVDTILRNPTIWIGVHKHQKLLIGQTKSCQ